MALPEAIVGVIVERPPGETDPLVFDATVESAFTRQADITNNPVETNDGDITDHRRTRPLAWRFRAIFVNEDPDPLVAAQRSAAADGSEPDPLKSARERGPQIDHVRAISNLARLQAIFDDKEVVDVTTDLDVIENAVLENFSYRTLASMPDPISGLTQPSAIEVSGVFRKIRFATTETVELPKEPVKRQTGKKVKRGPVQGKPADDELKKKSQSFLKLFTGGLD